MPLRLFRRRRYQDSADALYGALVAQAREPVFYAVLGVPDTLDGRFDNVALHAFLLLHRLKDEPSAHDLAQTVFDAMFADMDRNLREMGVGDLSVGKKIKAMAQAFYGRIEAYEAGLAPGDNAALADALRRNLYRGAAPTDAQVAVMADYLRAQVGHLAGQPLTRLLDGQIAFAPPAAALA